MATHHESEAFAVLVCHATRRYTDITTQHNITTKKNRVNGQANSLNHPNLQTKPKEETNGYSNKATNNIKVAQPKYICLHSCLLAAVPAMLRREIDTVSK